MLTPRTIGTTPDFPYVGNERATVFAYRNGCRVVWETRRESHAAERDEDDERAIKDQSRRSRHRAAFSLGNAECDWFAMSTLTYHTLPPASRVKADLDTFRRAWRAKWDEPLDAWIMEIQERGAPHFHLFTTFSIDKGVVARWWYEIVGSDDERHLRAGTRIERLRSGKDGVVAYANKYAAKSEQKEVPPEYTSVGRFWGVAMSRECVSAATRIALGACPPKRTARALGELKDGLKRMMSAGEVRKSRPNERATVYIARGLRAQRELKELIRGLAFAYQVESGIGNAFCEPLREEKPRANYVTEVD